MAETIVERNLRDAIDYLDRAMRFLVTDFGYADIGRVPVTTDDVVVRGYRNAQAGVQVEVSGHPPGETFVGGLRRLQSGAPLPYDRNHFLSLTDVALVRNRQLDDRLSHNLNPNGWKGVVDAAAELLRNSPTLLNGQDWIAHDSIAGEWRRHFQRTFGFEPAGDTDGWPLREFKPHFAFLIDRGYVLTYDTSTLTPHEYLVTKELRYESGPRIVTIRCVDFREDEWMVWCDDRPIGGVFHSAPQQIAAHASLVAAELR